MSIVELLPGRGRIAAPLELEVQRELTASDLLQLATPEMRPAAAPVLQRIRATHHRQALLLAQGYSAVDVASIVGSTPQRVRDLMKDPAFSDLMSQYADSAITELLEDTHRIQAKLVDLGEAAIDEMHDRVTDPEKIKAIPLGELRKISELALDRTVAPPKTAEKKEATPTNITISFGTALKTPQPGDDAKDVTPQLPKE